MTAPSDEARSFKSQIQWNAKRLGLTAPLRGPIALAFKLVPKNAICMDLDNALKVAIDALKGVAYVDDSQVRRITAERADPDGADARLEVEVHEIGAEATPLFSDRERLSASRET